jgi:chemotaxis protein histidine kinase CheA/ActR/RegA family two-component response regulator
MLSEHQQRIMGYFIAEAQNHLNTIEQGLVNLPAILTDSDRMSQVLRAIHSLKGGAAMLGADPIQQTAQQLENALRVLKRRPQVQVEPTLKTAFLRAHRMLHQLIDRLQTSGEMADIDATEIEPVFLDLNQRLSRLINPLDPTQPTERDRLQPIDLPDDLDADSNLTALDKLFEEEASITALDRALAEDSKDLFADETLSKDLNDFSDDEFSFAPLTSTADSDAADEFDLGFLDRLDQQVSAAMAEFDQSEEGAELELLADLFGPDRPPSKRSSERSREVAPEEVQHRFTDRPAPAADVSELHTLLSQAYPDDWVLEDEEDEDLSGLINGDGLQGSFHATPSAPPPRILPRILPAAISPQADPTAAQDRFQPIELPEYLSAGALEAAAESSHSSADKSTDALPQEHGDEDSLEAMLGDVSGWIDEIDALDEIDTLDETSATLNATIEATPIYATDEIDEGNEPIQLDAIQLDAIDQIIDQLNETIQIDAIDATDEIALPTEIDPPDEIDTAEESCEANQVNGKWTHHPVIVPTNQVIEAWYDHQTVVDFPPPTEFRNLENFRDLDDRATAESDRSSLPQATGADFADLFAEDDPDQLAIEELFIEENLFPSNADLQGVAHPAGSAAQWRAEFAEERDVSNISIGSDAPIPEHGSTENGSTENSNETQTGEERPPMMTMPPPGTEVNSIADLTAEPGEDWIDRLLGDPGGDASVNLQARSIAAAGGDGGAITSETQPAKGADERAIEPDKPEAAPELVLLPTIPDLTGPDPAESMPPVSVVNAEEFFPESWLTLDFEGANSQTDPVTDPLTDQTMQISVKHLDNLQNLVGEIVVNRNSLEQVQEQVRQFLDNLLYQVHRLNNVGHRMRDLYDRSLVETALHADRGETRLAASIDPAAQSHAVVEAGFDALEMDHFSEFHTLSQETIELIVRVRESASDIDFVMEETDQTIRNFRQITLQLRESLMRSRMVPFAQTIEQLGPHLYNTATQYGQEVELTVTGQETLIDKAIAEQLDEPLTQLVKYAVVHGIESPAERLAAGKSPIGQIAIEIFYQGNQIVIAIRDDGAGINFDTVKAQAIDQGLIAATAAQQMSTVEIQDLLFCPGFSMVADDAHGQAIELAVVRTDLSEIHGSISVDSTMGSGTTFTIRLPLTFSLANVLCCISDRTQIAFPVGGVEDVLEVADDEVNRQQSRLRIQWRDRLLPLQPLSELLTYHRVLERGGSYSSNQTDRHLILVLRSAEDYLAVPVDQVLGEQEVSIKPLEGPVPKPVGIVGATVLGNGRIMLVADIAELIDLSQGRLQPNPGSGLQELANLSVQNETAKTAPTVLIVDDSITVRELLSTTFSKVGYQVEQARDGYEAWEKLRSGLACDLVFCDIEMPRMDGLELLSRLQTDPNLHHIPVAMLTSRGADRHRQVAIQLGAKEYFTKPYLETVLLDAAQRLLQEKAEGGGQRAEG